MAEESTDFRVFVRRDIRSASTSGTRMDGDTLDYNEARPGRQYHHDKLDLRDAY